jgi:GMP synthase-like glutamine amidotransferase
MEYIHLKKVHLFFYSKDSSNNYNYLLYKNAKYDSFQHMYNDITNYDNGSIYSISRFLTKNFSYILTDDFISKIQSNIEFEVKNENKNLKQYELWENDTFNFWLNKLSKNPIQYDSINEEIIYFIEIQNLSIEFLNSLLEKNNFEYRFININENNFSSLKLSEETNKLFSLFSLDKMKQHINNTLKMKEEKSYTIYIILSLKTPGKDQNGFFHFPALFHSLYRKNNEEWKYINVSTDGLPSEELLSKTKAILIPGSNLSVYNDFDFLRQTEKFLKNLIDDILFNKKYPNLKLLGICFGMQIIVNALGGTIAKMTGERRGKPEDVEIIDDKFYDFNFYKNSGVEKRKILRINEAHGDEVVKYPEEKYKIKLYGSSKSCKTEIMVDEQEKILLIQGHPEYHPEFNSNRVAKLFLKFRFKVDNPTNEQIEKFINDFLVPINIYYPPYKYIFLYMWIVYTYGYRFFK